MAVQGRGREKTQPLKNEKNAEKTYINTKKRLPHIIFIGRIPRNLSQVYMFVMAVV
jgi:hypothetical protein